MSTPAAIEVIYTPFEIQQLPGRDLSAHTAVVIDVLRATSTIVTGLANGAAAFFPVAGIEEARELHAKDPGSLLAGERKGDPPEGFDLGNNPIEFTPQKIKGKRIYHTTTNGTQAFVACRGCRRVIAGALLNLRAVVEDLRKQSGPTLLVCAGTHEDFSLEDAIAAGFIVRELGLDHPVTAIYRSTGAHLPEALRQTRNGHALIKANRTSEIDWCAQVDKYDTLPVVQQNGWIK